MELQPSDKKISQLRFNFGFLLEAPLGTSRDIELDYPRARVAVDLILSPLSGRFQVVRTSEGLYLKGTLRSAIAVECVRCLEEARLPITFVMEELFYYPPPTAPEGELVIGEDGFIDLGPIVRDLSLLEVPIQPLCRPDCKGLCDHCGENLNEGPCDCEQDEVDGRLAILRSLLNGKVGQ